MSDALLSIEHGIAVVTLNRPRRLNAIGGTLLADLHDHLARAQAEPEARVIVLTGAGRAKRGRYLRRDPAHHPRHHVRAQTGSRRGRWLRGGGLLRMDAELRSRRGGG
jgi:hypothetical protein